MDELIKQVAQKSGITEAQAQTAVNTVLDFIKTKLPPNLAGQVDNLAAGKSLDLGSLGGLGSLFGGR
jgi:nucleoid DNA-binding protein